MVALPAGAMSAQFGDEGLIEQLGGDALPGEKCGVGLLDDFGTAQRSRADCSSPMRTGLEI